MQAVETKPEAPEQFQAMDGFDVMSSDQAIKVCPYLGRLAAQDPELAQQKAQEYMTNPENVAQMHENDADLWGELEDEFSTENDRGENRDAKNEVKAKDNHEPEPANVQLETDRMRDQEDIYKQSAASKKSKLASVKAESTEKSNEEIDIFKIARQTIADNPNSWKEFLNGDAEAKKFLSSEIVKTTRKKRYSLL